MEVEKNQLALFAEFIQEEMKKVESDNCLSVQLGKLMSQNQVGLADIHRVTGIPFSTLSDMKNRKNPYQKLNRNILELAKYFNVSIEYLVYGETIRQFNKREKIMNFFTRRESSVSAIQFTKENLETIKSQLMSFGQPLHGKAELCYVGNDGEILQGASESETLGMRILCRGGVTLVKEGDFIFREFGEVFSLSEEVFLENYLPVESSFIEGAPVPAESSSESLSASDLEGDGSNVTE